MKNEANERITAEYDGFSWVWCNERQKWLIDCAASGGPPSIHEKSPEEPHWKPSYKQQYDDLRAICENLMLMERTREEGEDRFHAALDELDEYLNTGHTDALQARREKP